MATLSIVSQPSQSFSGWARGTSGGIPSTDPSDHGLLWKAEALVSPPAGRSPYETPYAQPGSFTVGGSLVVRVVEGPGDTVGQPVRVSIQANGTIIWDNDPAKAGNELSTSDVHLKTGVNGQGLLRDLNGGSIDLDARSWSTSSDSDSRLFPVDTTVGATFTITVDAGGRSDAWVGGSGDAHGEVGVNLSVEMDIEGPSSPDIIIKKQGAIELLDDGVLVRYEVAGRPLPAGTPIFLFWSQTGTFPPGGGHQKLALSGGPIVAETSVGVHQIAIPLGRLTTPDQLDDYLMVVADADGKLAELSESNNDANLAIILASPQVEVVFDPKEAILGEQFGVSVRVTNRSIKPLKFSFDWSESYLLSNPILYGVPELPGEGKFVAEGLFLPNISRDIPLGVFTREWQWIDRNNPVTSFLTGALDLHENLAQEAAEFAAERLKAAAKELLEVAFKLKDVIGLLKAAMSTPKNFDTFKVEVGIAKDSGEAPGGLNMAPTSANGSVAINVSQDRRTAFTKSIASLGASVVAMNAAAGWLFTGNFPAAFSSFAAGEFSLELAKYYYDVALGSDDSPPAPSPAIQPPSDAGPLTAPQPLNFNGSSRGSRGVKSVQVAFNGDVTVNTGAFEIRGKNGKSIKLRVATNRFGGQTIASLGRSRKTQRFANGVYTLTTHGSRIIDSAGRAVDGDGDGIAGGDRVERFRIVRGRLSAPR
jgi:hypothetical protein